MPQYSTNRERGDRHSPDTRLAICKGQQLEVSILSTLESTASLRARGPRLKRSITRISLALRRGWTHGNNCHRQPRHDERTLAVRMDVEVAAQLPESFSHTPDSNPGSAR